MPITAMAARAAKSVPDRSVNSINSNISYRLMPCRASARFARHYISPFIGDIPSVQFTGVSHCIWHVPPPHL